MAGWLSGRRSLLCDLDGTLIDSLPALRLVHRSFLAARGVEPERGEFERYNGVPLAEVLIGLQTTHGFEGEPADLLAEYEALVDAAYLEVRPTPGAEALLAWAVAHDWRVAVVTSGQRGRAAAWLSRHGLAEHVDALVGAEDTDRGKPDPAPFLAALERLGADPELAWAIEDSDAGVRSALAAGIGRVVLLTDAASGGSSTEPLRCPDLEAVRTTIDVAAGR